MTSPPDRSAARSWATRAFVLRSRPKNHRASSRRYGASPRVRAHAAGDRRGPGAGGRRFSPPRAARAGRRPGRPAPAPTAAASGRGRSRPVETGVGRSRRASGIRDLQGPPRGRRTGPVLFLARRQSLIRCADTRTGRPRSSTRCSRTTASATDFRGGFPASLYSSARRSAKAVRAPESELKVPPLTLPRVWTSGPENSPYTADLRLRGGPETGTSSAGATDGRIRTR